MDFCTINFDIRKAPVLGKISQELFSQHAISDGLHLHSHISLCTVLTQPVVEKKTLAELIIILKQKQNSGSNQSQLSWAVLKGEAAVPLEILSMGTCFGRILAYVEASPGIKKPKSSQKTTLQ